MFSFKPLLMSQQLSLGLLCFLLPVRAQANSEANEQFLQKLEANLKRMKAKNDQLEKDLETLKGQLGISKGPAEIDLVERANKLLPSLNDTWKKLESKAKKQELDDASRLFFSYQDEEAFGDGFRTVESSYSFLISKSMIGDTRKKAVDYANRNDFGLNSILSKENELKNLIEQVNQLQTIGDRNPDVDWD